MIILNFLKAFYPDIIKKFVDNLFGEYSIHVRILLFIITILVILYNMDIIGPKPIPESFIEGYNIMMVEYFCNAGYQTPNDTLSPEVRKKECTNFYEIECNNQYIHKTMIEACAEYKKTGKFFYKEHNTK